MNVRINLPGLCLLGAALAAVPLSAPPADAASPAEIAAGRVLFEQNWSPRNPVFGGDGLGPLFNATSCVTCHNQGGVGGSGDTPFNAKSIGIETLGIEGGRITNEVISRMVSRFHPGFVGSEGSVVNVFSMPHHGGSAAYANRHAALIKQFPGLLSEHGGPLDHAEHRLIASKPLVFNWSEAGYKTSAKAWVFQRNTTALYGAGLIDKVKAKTIRLVAQEQKAHPEISGRPSTLRDGRFGRFGWRGNISSLREFNAQACANEMGLESDGIRQPIDPTQPGYRNKAFDISHEQIDAMSSFVSMLPAPKQILPSDDASQQEIHRGYQVFNSVGCAVCHRQNMGPAQNVYSDLLLHDMGSELVDFNAAEPYRVRFKEVKRRKYESRDGTLSDTMPTHYYGGAASITIGGLGSNGSVARSSHHYKFRNPRYPDREEFVVQSRNRVSPGSASDAETNSTAETARRRGVTLVIERGTSIDIQPTEISQEWRTPPLWGVADSAPYMHDGRAETLLEAIAMHDGESAGTRDRFLNLSVADRHAVIAFMKSLRAPQNAPQQRSIAKPQLAANGR